VCAINITGAGGGTMMEGKAISKAVACVSLALCLLGFCAGGGLFSGNYKQIAPTKYPQTDRVFIFEYPHADINQVYESLFSDYLIIGKSSFISGHVKNYEQSSDLFSQASSVGSNIAIVAFYMKQRKVDTITDEDDSERVAVIEEYEYNVFYLRNVNKIVPVWDRNSKDYVKTGPNALEGVWYNEQYEMNVCQSGNNLVGCRGNGSENMAVPGRGNLVFLFDVNTKAGVFIKKNGTPMPGVYTINKFGHLSITLKYSNDIVSFARKK
jgi:hypothetical protein